MAFHTVSVSRSGSGAWKIRPPSTDPETKYRLTLTRRIKEAGVLMDAIGKASTPATRAALTQQLRALNRRIEQSRAERLASRVTATDPTKPQ